MNPRRHHVAAVLAFALALLCGVSPASAQRSFCPDPASNAACVAVTASAAGSTGAITATLPASAVNKTTYICALFYQGTNATTANTATSVTVTGVITGTLTFGFPTLALGATVPNPPPLNIQFNPCVPASAAATAIAVNGPALGAGATLATIAAWGYQL